MINSGLKTTLKLVYL